MASRVAYYTPGALGTRHNNHLSGPLRHGDPRDPPAGDPSLESARFFRVAPEISADPGGMPSEGEPARVCRRVCLCVRVYTRVHAPRADRYRGQRR